MSLILKSDAQAYAHDNIVTPMNELPNGPGAPIGANVGLTYCNNAMLEYYNYDPSEGWLATYLSGNISRAALVSRIQTLGAWYSRSVTGMYGLTGTTTTGSYDGYTPPFNELAIFFVQPGWHQANYDASVAAINAAGTSELFNNVGISGLVTYLTRVKNIIFNNISGSALSWVDLRVCHSSCHSNCHGSRGRR
jgi:hypothetical protein